jgi:hypothetical protein
MGVNGVQQFFMGVGFLTTLVLLIIGAVKLAERRDSYGARLMARAQRRDRKRAARSEDPTAD